MNRIEPKVPAHFGVMVLVAAAMEAESRETLGQRLVVGHHHTAVAETAQVLRRIEGEATDVADASGAPSALVAGADRLGRVLDDRDAESAGGVQQGFELDAASEQVNRDDRLGSVGDGGDGLGRVDVVRTRFDVHEDRPGAEAPDDPGGREERVGGRDHLAAGACVERHQGDEQRVSPRGDAHAEPDRGQPGEFALEGFDLGPEDEALGFEHARDGGLNLGFNRGVLRAQVQQRYLHSGAPSVGASLGRRITQGSHKHRKLTKPAAAACLGFKAGRGVSN